MKYKKDDWRENVKRGLYDRGSAKDIYKYDRISFVVYEGSRLHFANSVIWYRNENIDWRKVIRWEEVFEYVERDGMNFFGGDQDEVYKAVKDGKITRRTIPDNHAGYHHRIRPEREYFFACIKPMQIRFTVNDFFD